MKKKNKIFNEDVGPLFGLIDLCPGRISPWKFINPIYSFCQLGNSLYSDK
jgi:hypothetical protein